MELPCIQHAAENFVARNFFLGVSKFQPLHADLSTFLSGDEYRRWQALKGNASHAYKPDTFLYSEGTGQLNSALFARAFSHGICPVDGWNDVERFILSACGLNGDETRMHPFVLSKTSQNMSWHVACNAYLAGRIC